MLALRSTLLSLGGHKVCSRSCGGQPAAGGIRHQVHQILAIVSISLSEEPPLVWCIGSPAVLGVGPGQIQRPSLLSMQAHPPLSKTLHPWRALLCPYNNVDAIGLWSSGGCACRRIAWVSFWSQLSLAIISAIVVAFTMSSSSNVRLSRLLHAPVLTHAVQCHVSGFPGCYMLPSSRMRYSATRRAFRAATCFWAQACNTVQHVEAT